MLKNGANPYFDPFALPSSSQKGGEKSLSREQTILRLERESKKVGLVALPLAFSNIDGSRLALCGFNISAQAYGISQAL